MFSIASNLIHIYFAYTIYHEIQNVIFFFSFFLHHNIVYSKSPVYNNLNGPGVNIKGPCFT